MSYVRYEHEGPNGTDQDPTQAEASEAGDQNFPEPFVKGASVSVCEAYRERP